MGTALRRRQDYEEALSVGQQKVAVDEDQVTVEYTNVFEKNMECKTKLVSNRGGSRSSKSYSLAQMFLSRFFTCKGRQILVVRKTLPALRISTYLLFSGLIDKYGLRPYIKEEKQGMNLWHNGSLIHFGGIDDPEKIKSTEWNDIWMEEANEFSYEDFVQLNLRLSAPLFNFPGMRNQLFMSFNPMDENCWIKKRVYDSQVRSKDLTDIHSSYLDNPYLDDDYIESIKALEHEDRNYYNIFALGHWGRLEHIIYKNWDTVPHMIDGDVELYGIDFGFNAPSVIMKIAVTGWDAVVQEKIYQTGLTNEDLIERLDDIVPRVKRQNYPIYCDSAEPQRIEEIKRAGFKVKGADKSVTAGIDTVKRFKIHIVEDSANTLKEVRGYSYKVGKDEIALDKPIEFNNHAMDAMRYGLHTHFVGRLRKGSIRVRYI
jgi:phage terminase large subunit